MERDENKHQKKEVISKSISDIIKPRKHSKEINFFKEVIEKRNFSREQLKTSIGHIFLLFCLLYIAKVLYIFNFILNNKITFIILFFICGFYVYAVAKVYAKNTFIKEVLAFILIYLGLQFILSAFFLVFALGGKQGAVILNIIASIPGHFFLYSISSKFSFIAIINCYLWAFILQFMPENFFFRWNKYLKKSSLILFSCLILFFPAIYYYIVGSKDLLKFIFK